MLHRSHVSLNTVEINNSRQFLVWYAQKYWHVLQGHCFNIQCIWQCDLRYSFLSPAFVSPSCLSHSSFPFSSPYSIWAVFPTISRDWDCLKWKEQKIWKGERKTVATRLKERLYRGENSVWDMGSGEKYEDLWLELSQWNPVSLLLCPSLLLWLFDSFPLTHSWNQPYSQALY